MQQSLGARLRQQREHQQISLASIAEQTKIKASLLEGLERDDVSHWPVGIFRRAFIRSYAQTIGLKPAVVLEEFLTLHPDPPDVAAADPSEVTVEGRKQHTKPPMRLRFLVGSALGSLARGREGAVSAPAAAVPAPVPSEPVTETTAPVVETARPVAGTTGSVAETTESVAKTTRPVPETTEPVTETTESGPETAESGPETAESGPETAESVSQTIEPITEPTEPVTVATAFEPDLLAVARVCTALSRVDQRSEMAPLLAEVARLLDAIGLVIWVWDPRSVDLRAVLAHGYADSLLAQLPAVSRTSDNATAAAFRSSETCIVAGSDRASGAVVVPLMTPGGCGGVLALEVPNGREQAAAVRGVATIFAAQLARWIRDEREAEVPDRRRA
jgi:cytoskeletal protein RodZ